MLKKCNLYSHFHFLNDFSDIPISPPNDIKPFFNVFYKNHRTLTAALFQAPKEFLKKPILCSYSSEIRSLRLMK